MSAFSDYVTSTAFHLHLSKNQCTILCLVAEGNLNRLYAKGWAVPALRNLRDKGLVSHHYIPPQEAPEGHIYHTITREGALVYELLKMAGIANKLVEDAA